MVCFLRIRKNVMKNNTRYSIGLVLVAASMLVNAGDRGSVLDKQLCELCHGPSGTTTSELFPQLAGQPAPYLINQMKEFRDKTRSEENARRFMWGIASRLSDEDIQNLATHYEAQQPAPGGKITNKIKYETGKTLYTNGNADKGVPPCLSCHGEKAEGKDATPRLGGQHEAYLLRQLKVFYGNERPAAIAMHEIVKGLSDADLEALAHYLQAQ